MRHDLTTTAARRALAAALALGLLADLLLRTTPWGMNATLWILALLSAGALVGTPHPDGGEAEARPWRALAAAALPAIVFTWRASPALLALCGGAVLVALAAGLLQRPARSGVAAWALAGFGSVVAAGLGAVMATVLAFRGAPRRWRPVAAIALGSLLAAPLLAVLVALFASADPLFAEILRDIARPLEDVAEHGGTILLAAWLAGGALVARAALRVEPEVGLPAPRAAAAPVLVAVALVGLLFLVFLAVQARALVGGRELVEATLGLTYAEYARQGFFQLVVSAAIVLPPLLAADWAIPPGAALRRWFVAVAGGLSLLVLLVLASAARRLALYVSVYGLTEDRLYASAFLVWLAVTGVVFAATVLRGSRRRFMLGALLWAGVVLGGLAILNPAGAIVRVNAAARSPAGFDAVYATTLGADAVPALLEVLPRLEPAARCYVAAALLERWGEGAPPDARTWNLARARARHEVADTRAELRAAACPGQTGGKPDRQRLSKPQA